MTPKSAPDQSQAIALARTGRTAGKLVYAIEADSVNDARDPRWITLAYRSIEIVIALIGLSVTLPIMLLEAIIIRLDSPGPALFFQRRVARSKKMRGSELLNNPDILPPGDAFDPDKYYYVPRTFTFIKFRTMYYDAKTRFPELYRYQYTTQESFLNNYYKLEDDPRVTRAGRWLRRLTVDEFPNFWHVLTGSVGLVGPRPELPEYLPYYTPDQMRKFVVRPGITGLAQTNGRSLLTIGDIIAWDLKYVDSRSVLLDIQIILRTIWLVLTRRGAF
jgi:lipopolysaccharide/colanic/teichoic acid biosynthesis glycosyltransferase